MRRRKRDDENPAPYKMGCRLTEKERDDLIKRAKKAGYTVAEYIRSKILPKRKPVVSLGEPVEDE